MNTNQTIFGKCIPLEMNNVDTDLIIPAQYLTSVTKNGYGINLFKRLRENSNDFVFNQKKFQNSSILITQENFGCGSSREHAVWALKEYGIQVVIASSFADIFAGNSLKNKLLLIQLDKFTIQKLILNSSENEYFLNIDLKNNSIHSSLNEDFEFVIDSFQKSCFMNGFDEIDYLMTFKNKIVNFKNAQIEQGIIPSLNH
ncbi:3-isopropylmalate dehydratase small subunit [Silvanigrella paludirubra]|uniref:3-isopropylmalate dehydratase small subunit n=1 Tax=Silvanigrella paludirubra TaxID=2499159 RepID=A0A6N6VUR4_9BACT|nr:3-isopropylmalate dehydratase small subunit [Silvanigrella paludirubra]KAB8037931.1 3-isopropylmalate dehydratase small subunit [Silvanigrella paludirubra]